MYSAEALTQITEGNLESLIAEDTTILLACIRKDDSLRGHIEALESVARSLGDTLKVCFVLDDLTTYFMEEYGFHGTPTFLVLQNGVCFDGLFGKKAEEDLIEFVQRSLPPGKNKIQEGGGGHDKYTAHRR